MQRTFKLKTIPLLLLLAASASANASDFNIPFVTAAGLGNLYAGWAASAEDASTTFTNPAGLPLLNHEQLVASAIGVTGSAQFTGTATNPIFPVPLQTGTASTKLRGLIPTFYYASPAFRNIVFGFGSSAPFALGSNYATDSIVRYAATRSQILVVDMGPSVGVKINDMLSVGVGLDVDRLTFTLNQMYGPPLSVPDANGQNHLAGWGYGWHGGFIFQPVKGTRVGLNFHSLTAFHTTGDSEVFGNTGELRTKSQRSNAPMPARTVLTITQALGTRITAMATVFYTNWSSLSHVPMTSTMTPSGATIPVYIPFEYHNTFDYSLGLKVVANDKWFFRTGLEILTTPTNNRDRSVSDPLGAGIVLGMGFHYQQNAHLGYDLSYAHGFFDDTSINYATALAQLKGYETQNTNVLGGQVTWNIT